MLKPELSKKQKNDAAFLRAMEECKRSGIAKSKSVIKKLIKVALNNKTLIVLIYSFFFATQLFAQNPIQPENIIDQNKDTLVSITRGSINDYETMRYFAKIDSCQRIVNKLNDHNKNTAYWYYISTGDILTGFGGCLSLICKPFVYDERVVQILRVERVRNNGDSKTYYSQDLWDK